jgi:nicotinate phosphoribosyltransferase
MNSIHFQTVVASKAARVVLAAPKKLLVDFGMRRAHGAEAALLAARASYLAGFDGTSTVLALPMFGIPIYGTMAHSFVQAHDDEAVAFERFASSHPQNAVLLLDTYDTERAARTVVDLVHRSRIARPAAVRLDSGDLVHHARCVRAILDRGDLREVRIFSSGGLDEHRIAALFREGAPIDGFGVGTAMDTSADAPYLDCAYKLVEYAGRGRRKLSEGKATWPGRKQVYRICDQRGSMIRDVVTIEGDRCEGEPLVVPVMRSGRRLNAPETHDRIRERVRSQLDRLPAARRSLAPAPPHPVEISAALRAYADSCIGGQT